MVTSNIEKEFKEAGVNPESKLLQLTPEELENLRKAGEENKCPICGVYPLIKEGRCSYCYDCGYSRCDL